MLQGIRRRQRDQGISESLCAGFGRGRNCHHSVSSRCRGVVLSRAVRCVFVWRFPPCILFDLRRFFAEGFLLSFAVVNYTLALGRSGVLISLCVFGTRILMIFPVSIAIALRRMRSAGERAGRRTARQKTSSGSRDRRCFLFGSAILALGVLAELTFVPKLVSLALRQLS